MSFEFSLRRSILQHLVDIFSHVVKLTVCSKVLNKSKEIEVQISLKMNNSCSKYMQLIVHVGSVGESVLALKWFHVNFVKILLTFFVVAVLQIGSKEI